MQTIVVDTETYYSTSYTLTKLTPVEYVRDPQFKLHGVGIKIDDQPAKWYTLDTLKDDKSIDWANSMVVLHNALFDSLILTENLGLPIKHWSDTLSLAKSLIAVPKHNLDFLSKLLLKDEKMKDESGISMVNVGKKLVLSPEEDALMGEYCIQDVNLTYRLYHKLRPMQTDLEERVLSTTINWYAHPILTLDQGLLASELVDIQANKERLIIESGFTRAELSSNSIFVSKIEALGIEFPKKLNPKGQPIHATGKADPEFIQLKEAHPEHKIIWEARDAIKSSLLEARIQTFQRVGNLAPNSSQSIPVPLVYAGSHTYRWAGTQYNLMNLPNLRTSKLRSCIRAPKDHVIVVADSSQIELRINMWFCGQLDVHELLAKGKDLYKHYAATSLNKPESEVTKTERQLAKVKILGLGYQMGPDKFRHTLATGALGSDPVYISEAEAKTAVAEYRSIHHKVVGTWAELTNVIFDMHEAEPSSPITVWRGLEITKECITLPDGMKLRYPNLLVSEDGNFEYGFSPKIHKIYSGLAAENIVQALARSVIAEQIIKIEDLGYRTVHMVHDEVLVVCHKDLADKCLADMLKVMSTTPSWATGLVLSAEGDYDVTYCK